MGSEMCIRDSVTHMHFFEPGNYIYARAFHLAFGPLAQHYQWNQQTLGDVFEAILGLAFLYKRQLHDSGSTLPGPLYLATWVELLVYKVCTASSLLQDHAVDAQTWANNVYRRSLGNQAA